MDDIKAVSTARTRLRISAEETARRRESVRWADAHNRLEGVFRDPASDAVFDAFVRGEFDVTKIVPRLKVQLSPR